MYFKFHYTGEGALPPPFPDTTPLFFDIKFYLKYIKFYSANQCVPRRHKNKHLSEWATFEEYWYALEYEALLISRSTNFLQPSPYDIYLLSYDQLWAASLIGRNAVQWRWALSFHRFTVTRGDITRSPGWHYNITPGDCEAVTWRSLNANVRYIVRCFCLRFCLFLFDFLSYDKTYDTVVRGTWKYARVWHFQPRVVIFPCPTHYCASSV